MADVKLFQADGKEGGKTALPDTVFGAYMRVQTVQRYLLRQLGNARRANPRTLTKGDVSGTGKKPFRQKGTGRARQGSLRNPHNPGGGVAHGPDGRKYTTSMNRKERRRALSSLLSSRVRKEQISVLKPLRLEAPRTRRVVELVKNMGFEGQKVLFVTDSRDENFERSVRNIPTCKSLLYSNLNPHDLLRFDQIVLFEGAVEKIVAQIATEPKPAGSRAASSDGSEEARA